MEILKTDPNTVTPHQDAVKQVIVRLKEANAEHAKGAGIDGTAARMRMEVMAAFIRAVAVERDFNTDEMTIAKALSFVLGEIVTAHAYAHSLHVVGPGEEPPIDLTVTCLNSLLAWLTEGASHTLTTGDWSVGGGYHVEEAKKA